MKKYKTGGWKELIEEVEIVKETDRCVFIRQDYFGKMRDFRQAKRSSSTNYWNTIKEAKEFLKGKAEGRIESYEERIKSCKKELKKLEQY